MEKPEYKVKSNKKPHTDIEKPRTKEKRGNHIKTATNRAHIHHTSTPHVRNGSTHM